MAPRARDEIMVHDSIEAKGDEDVDMEDVQVDGNANNRNDIADAPTGVDTNGGVNVEVEADADGEADTDGAADAEGQADDGEPADTSTVRRGKGGGRGRWRSVEDPHKELRQLIDDTQKYLCTYKEDGEQICDPFQRIPRKNIMPEYHEVITNPIAFSTVRSKLVRKEYTAFSQFVHDVAQIFRNAQVFNRPNSLIFKYSVRLLDVFKEKLQELIEDGSIQAQDAELPDFGELPPVEDSPSPDPEDEEIEDEDEEEEEEEDDDDDDSDDEGGRRRGRRRGRTFKKDADDDDDYHKKRGRPPKVFTPTEARIHAILKGLRKPKNEDGNLRILHFERLPDKQLNKEYYQTIENPIALDQIKRNAKRKKYRNVDELLADIELMFENAMQYNEEGSDIYDDAVELQKVARQLVDLEKGKSDDAFRDEEGKLPLSEVQHNGETWKVGDWVHIRNMNDLQKPIVAQIYRLWQDEAGKKWINACWYYRPEQTVHRVSKRFYKNEVMKTGQYRDHLVEDIVDRCFVMFHTRYHKGRPRGFSPDKEIYVCEARYNEEKYTFNRIKTWTSCLPDEIREKDYEMDLFDIPRKIKKEPTPIAHLLAPDARETDPLPRPNWGAKDAPPIIGGVHIRPREANSVPMPVPMPMAPAPTAFHPGAPGPMQSPSPAHAHHFQQSHFVPPRPIATTPSAISIQPMQQQQQQQQQQLQHHPVPSPAHVAQSPHFAPQHNQGYGHHPQQPHFVPSPAPVGHHHHLPNNSYAPQSFTPSAVPVHQQPRMPMAPTASNTAIPHANANANMYNPPRPVEVYHLRDDIDAAIPAEVREQYQTDDKGHVLFFTAPPLNRPYHGVAEEHATLGHSVRYLSDIAKHRAERERKRKERDEALERERAETAAREKEIREQQEREMGAVAGQMLGDYFLGLQRGNERMAKELEPVHADKAAWEAEKNAMKQQQQQQQQQLQ
ncbi:Chromatin structure-remodeling complex subunit RSC1 [Cytospora mali]|uniref:Chromatin structure-remodeling complex subunit RSC1 n=1 Tax=Cytospora mali TaxID=578113 RepID=A0A194V674_CYTMA|nr:Chromatin structure-remodeling complex subunit RSC1 [Valsa mali var. pyri (nom. inval.)]